MSEAAVIIPTFNEGSRVVEVIEVAKANSSVGEVVVVNDGSTDNTPAILNSIDGITAIHHAINWGKGWALDTGVRHIESAGYDTAVFLDADLVGLNSGHITELLKPLDEQDSQMAIAYLGLRKAVVKKYILSQWGALSGQRAIKTSIWGLLADEDKEGFNVEAALNARLRVAGLHRGIARVAFEGVSHVGKREKLGSLPNALRGYAKTYGGSLKTYARIELERATS